MTPRVFNFLWLNLDLPAKPDPENGIRQPLPEKYIENLRKAGKDNPDMEVMLWVDSARLTENQMAYLKDRAESRMDNVHIKDLRRIPEYDREALYNKGETDNDWRHSKHSLIWRQVDCAKILISLQGDYAQRFFSDLDHAHLDIDSSPVQDKLEKHGLMIGSVSDRTYTIENQLWGFTGRRYDFFEDYYKSALRIAYSGRNAWGELVDRVDELMDAEKLDISDICLKINGDGSRAEHPARILFKDNEEKHKPSTVAADPLADAFKDGAAKDKAATPPPSFKTPPTLVPKGKPR